MSLPGADQVLNLEILKYLEILTRVCLSQSCDPPLPPPSNHDSRPTGTNPYRTGTNPYRTGTNPYRTGTNPYRTGKGSDGEHEVKEARNHYLHRNHIVIRRVSCSCHPRSDASTPPQDGGMDGMLFGGSCGGPLQQQAINA